MNIITLRVGWGGHSCSFYDVFWVIAVRRDRPPGSMNATAMSQISHVLDPLSRTVQFNAPFISFMHAVAKNVLADLLLHCFLHILEL